MRLDEARNEILTRMGAAPSGPTVDARAFIVDAFIRQTARSLDVEARWSSMERESKVELIEGQAAYEIPEQARAGDLLTVSVETGRVARLLVRGIPVELFIGGPQEPSLRERTGRLERFDVVDRDLVLFPAPSGIEPEVTLRYSAPMPLLVQPDEVLPFDAQLIIAGAWALAAAHFELPNAANAFESYRAQANRVLRLQGVATGVNLARPSPPPDPAVRDVGPNVPWSPDWRPW